MAVTTLPVEACIEQIGEALAGPGVAVLHAPPGAGKTTLVPLRLLDQPWLAGRRIVMLEPRRLATRAAATRMASLLRQPVGATVGYRTRDEQRVGPATRVEVVTEGILTRRLQHDPALPGVGLVIFDEVHERNLQSDLALAFALDVRSGLRPDLRLMAMSATVDTEGIAALLGVGRGAPAPVVVSHGRQHPVEIRWSPPSPHRRPDEAMAAAVLRAVADDPGDVLVFLPGAADIGRVRTKLAGALPEGVDLLPLFGALPSAQQDLALAPSRPGGRRVVLATDIAETSLTVNGVRVVVDGGQVRSPRYDPGTGLTRLHTGAASRSSADQRAGRAGREAPGVAYRLWSEVEHVRRPLFAKSEMASVDLAGLVLELAVWGAAPDQLLFLERPPEAALADGRALLVGLGALDEPDGRPTARGRRMADLPLHPRLARMVVDAVPLGLGWVACALAALLEDRDILRGRPEDVGADVAERVALITDAQGRHHLVDQAARASARRRADQLARRVDVRVAPVDIGDCGRVLVLAYPDRLAQARIARPTSASRAAGTAGPAGVGGGRPSAARSASAGAGAGASARGGAGGPARFRLRGGSGAWLPGSDPLARENFLVVGQLDPDQGDDRIRLAAALDEADLESAAGASVTTSTELTWDEDRADLRATQTRRLDHLVLSTTERKAPPGAQATAAVLGHVRATELAALSWTQGARLFQRRVMFLRRTFGDPWPDLSDPALLASIDSWLAPRLSAAMVSDRAGLERLDLTGVLRGLVGSPGLAQMDALAPTSLPAGNGRRLRVDYHDDAPSAAVKVQELFGVTRHPAIAGGRVPLVLHLLSPAGRPIQVTADLPGFWAGSYAAVRKDMAGRYPRHAWPGDPATAEVPTGRRSRTT